MHSAKSMQVRRSVTFAWRPMSATRSLAIDADLSMKERALERTAPLKATAGRFRPDDALLRFLNDL